MKHIETYLTQRIESGLIPDPDAKMPDHSLLESNGQFREGIADIARTFLEELRVAAEPLVADPTDEQSLALWASAAAVENMQQSVQNLCDKFAIADADSWSHELTMMSLHFRQASKAEEGVDI